MVYLRGGPVSFASILHLVRCMYLHIVYQNGKSLKCAVAGPSQLECSFQPTSVIKSNNSEKRFRFIQNRFNMP